MIRNWVRLSRLDFSKKGLSTIRTDPFYLNRVVFSADSLLIADLTQKVASHHHFRYGIFNNSGTVAKSSPCSLIAGMI